MKSRIQFRSVTGKKAEPKYRCNKCEGYVYEDSSECNCKIEVWRIKDMIDELKKKYCLDKWFTKDDINDILTELEEEIK